jgi:hypothetical protein
MSTKKKVKNVSNGCRGLYLVLVFDGPEKLRDKLETIKNKNYIISLTTELLKTLDDTNFCLKGCCKKNCEQIRSDGKKIIKDFLSKNWLL